MLPERFTEDRNIEWAADDRTGVHDRVKPNLKRKETKKKTKPERKKRKRKSAHSPLLKCLKQRDSHFLGLALPEKLNNVGRCHGQGYWTDRQEG